MRDRKIRLRNYNARWHQAFPERAQNKQIHIEWKVGNDKSKRLMKVGDDIAFQQSGDDLSGSFSAAFSHLSLE